MFLEYTISQTCSAMIYFKHNKLNILNSSRCFCQKVQRYVWGKQVFVIKKYARQTQMSITSKPNQKLTSVTCITIGLNSSCNNSLFLAFSITYLTLAVIFLTKQANLPDIIKIFYTLITL